MKKPPRGRRKLSPSERKRRSRSCAQGDAVSERSKASEAASKPMTREEPCYIRFGLPPPGDGSENSYFKSREAGLSVFHGSRITTTKRGKEVVSYRIEIPEPGDMVSSASQQSNTLISLILENRPVYAIDNAHERGLGGDWEPVIEGGDWTHITFARIEVPEWWEEEGKRLEKLWYKVRRVPRLRVSDKGLVFVHQRLTSAAQELMDEIISHGLRVLSYGQVDKEDEERLCAIGREARHADETNLKNVGFISPKLKKRALQGKRNAAEHLTSQPSRLANVSGEGVEMVDRVLSLASRASKNSQVHGPEHWKRVAVAGREILRKVPDADGAVVLRFALTHDMMRYSDASDLGHGRRAASMVEKLFGEELSPAQLALLKGACAEHELGRITTEPTVGVCWDADRLNLWRVRKRPSEVYLSTEAAKELIDWANEDLLRREEITWPDVFELYGETPREEELGNIA